MRADEFINEDCWSGYKQVGMKKKGTKNVPNCVPVEENASGDSSLHDWFTKSKASDGTKGWVQIGGKYAGKPCAKQPGQTTKPKCGSSKMKRNLNAKEEEAAARKKRREDPNPDRRGKAKNVATKTNEEQLEEKWSKKYKDSINCSNPKGFSQRAHCQGKKKTNEAATSSSWENTKTIDDTAVTGGGTTVSKSVGGPGTGRPASTVVTRNNVAPTNTRTTTQTVKRNMPAAPVEPEETDDDWE